MHRVKEEPIAEKDPIAKEDDQALYCHGNISDSLLCLGCSRLARPRRRFLGCTIHARTPDPYNVLRVDQGDD